LREEYRFRVFENEVLNIIFGHKMEDITGDGESYIIRR
jgi:hypothetical protein